MRSTQFRFPVTTLAGSRLNNIFSLQKGHRVEPKYRLKFFLSAVVAGIFEIFSLSEKILYQKRIREYKPGNPPVFIIGFWRSGTTLLHNLLCQDPEASYTTTFQTVFPNILLTQSWWLKKIINHLVPVNRPFDNVRMDMDFPQEEEFGMMNVQPNTIYKFFIYPVDFDRIIDKELFPADISPQEQAQWRKEYAGMIAKAAINTGGRRFIGKNPCNLTRIRLLRQMYPDAKFIFIHRDPYQVVESLYRFILSIFPGVQLQDTPAGFTREKVAILYQKIMHSYFRERENIPPSDLFEISMEDFLRDKTGHLRTIYKIFGLGDFERALPGVEKYLSENPNSRHEPCDPEPETIHLVNQYALDILKELGYKSRVS